MTDEDDRAGSSARSPGGGSFSRSVGVEGAPGGDARRPVAAGDAPDIEVDRVLDGLVGRILITPLVPARLEPMQRLDEAERRLDGIGAGRGLAHMHRHAPHMHLEPQDTDLGADEAVPHRLGNERRGGAIAALEAGEGAVAGALFLDHRLHMDVGRRPVPGALQRIDGRGLSGAFLCEALGGF